jgi:hypothetical protein
MEFPFITSSTPSKPSGKMPYFSSRNSRKPVPYKNKPEIKYYSEYDKVLKLCKLFNISGVELNIPDNFDIPVDDIFIPAGQNFVIKNVGNIPVVPSSSYNLRSRQTDKLIDFIEKIIRCIEEFLRSIRKKIIHIDKNNKHAYIIVDNSTPNESWMPNTNDAQVTFSISDINKDDILSQTPNFQFRSNQVKDTLTNSETIKQLHIGWVNGMAPVGGQQRIPGLGLLILFYAILQSFLKYNFLIKGSLDNDSDYNDTYDIFGFIYDSGIRDNKYAPEMSSSLNVEKMINDILPVICATHPQICECIDRVEGGKRTKKRKTKRRKTKRRKTKRRRKY